MTFEIQKFESIQVDHDLEVEGCFASANQLFFGRLCLADNDGLKLYKLKNQVPTRLQHRDADKFSADDHVTCASWYRRAVREGYAKHMTEIFPVEHLLEDFTEVDYDAQIADLYEKYNGLDAWLQSDAEAVQIMITALQAAGDITVVIDQKIAAEASLRSTADSQESSERLAADGALDTRVQVLEADDTSQTLLDAETASRVAGDNALDTRLDVSEQKVSYTDPVSQTQVTSQISAATTALVNGAPGQLQTLDALALAIGDDQNYASTVTALIGTKQAASSHLDTLVSSARTSAQLASLDTTTSITAHLAGKQGTSTYLNNVNSAQLSTEKLQSLDTTTSLVGHLALKADQITTYSKNEVDGKVITTAQAADIATNSGKTSYSDAALVTQHTSDIAARRLISESYSQSEIDGKVITTAQAANIVTNSGKTTYSDAALVTQHTSDIAARRLISESYTQAEVNSAVAAKQASNAYLDNVVAAQRTQAQLEKVDFTSSGQTQLNALSSGKQVSNAYLDNVVAAQRTQAQLEKVDFTSSGQTQLNALSTGKQAANSHLDSVVSAARSVAQLQSVDTTSSLTAALAGKISSLGAQTFAGNIIIQGSGAEGGLTVETGSISLDASKKVIFGGSKLVIGMTGNDAVLESDTGNFLIKNYKNGASGDFKVQMRSGGSTYHNDAFKVSYDGNCSTAGNFSASGGTVIFTNLPTAETGLATGQLYQDNGVLKIKE